MADIFPLKNCLLKSASLNMGVGSEFSFDSAPDLAGDSSFAIDDVVRYVVDGPKALFKGVVKRIAHALGEETVTVTCAGMEQVLEGQTWNARYSSYNQYEGNLCGRNFVDATIQDFIDSEFNDYAPWGFVSQVSDWFTSITVPASIGSLRAGATVTAQKSFIETLNAIIAPYPHIKWAIRYDNTDNVFPIGVLVLIDTSVAVADHTLQYGGDNAVVFGGTLEVDANDSAVNLHVYGKGNFTELEEVLQEDWDAENEVIPITEKALIMPTAASPDNLYKSYSFFDFQDAQDIINDPLIEVLVDGTWKRAWHFADYIIDYENGRIEWLNIGSYVDANTGQLYQGVPDPSIVSAGALRRVFAYGNAHFGLSARISFDKLHPDAYRKYRVSGKLFNLKLRPSFVFDPESTDPDNPDWVEKALPVEDATVIMRPAAEYKMLDVFAGTIPDDPPHIAVKITPNVDRMVPPQDVMLSNTAYDAYAVALGDFDFQDGDSCIVFTYRQLSYVCNTPGFLVPGTAAGVPYFIPGQQGKFFTWAMKIRYTNWANLEVTKTCAFGLGKHQRVVLDSVLKYTDIDGNVIQDDTARLGAFGDLIKDYNDMLAVSGSLKVHVGITAGVPSVPYNVGETVSIAGNVSTELSDLVAVISSINYSTLDEGYVTLQLSRNEPRINKFQPSPAALVDIEGASKEPVDRTSLELI